MRDRAQADAHELVANATFDEAKTSLFSVKPVFSVSLLTRFPLATINCAY